MVTYSAWEQIATITCPNGQVWEGSGSGEGIQQDRWEYAVTAAGLYTFKVKIEYEHNGRDLSQFVMQSGFNSHTLHETVVFSEDGADTDKNDCFITFLWFSRAERQAGRIEVGG